MTGITTFDNAVVVTTTKLRVQGKNLTAECKISDGPLNVKVYGTHVKHIYYMLRFMSKDSRHKVTGVLGVSAYTLPQSVRPMASIRIGLRAISAFADEDDAGNVTRSIAPRLGAIDLVSNPLKMKFILYKYAFENWDDNEIIFTSGVNKAVFSSVLLGLYNNLVQRQVIPNGFPPVVQQDIPLDKEVFNSFLRPTDDIIDRGSVTTFRVNPRLLLVDFEAAGFAFEDLCNNVPFAVDSYVDTLVHSSASNGTTTTESSSSSTSTSTAPPPPPAPRNRGKKTTVSEAMEF